MTLFVLLLLSAHLCLGDHSVAKDNDNVQRRVPQISAIATTFNASGGWDLSVGDTTVITCKVTLDRDKKADDVQLRLVWTKPGDNSTTVLTTETASRGISFTLGPVTVDHRGMYSCRNDGSNSRIFMLDWHEFVWVKDPSASVNVELISENRVKFFLETTVTVSCRGLEDSSQWKIMRADDIDGIIELCPDQVKKDNAVSCTVPESEYSLNMPYWCQSAAGQTSDVINSLTAVRELRQRKEKVEMSFKLTPAWYLRTGDGALLNCAVTKDDHRNSSESVDLQLIWTQLVSEENNMKVLLSQRASRGVSYSLNNVSREQSGVYTCWDDGALPNVSVEPVSRFVWVEEDSPAVFINVVSPNRTQFFRDEKVTIGCQLPNDQSQWKIKWYDVLTRTIKQCRNPTISSSRFLSCTMYMTYPWFEKLFWCESATGEKSNLLNTTTTMFNIVLEAPTLPVTAGDEVTLRCWEKEQNTHKIIPLNAGFHVNLNFIGTSKEGTITKRVTEADEGFFQCSTRQQGMGQKTWVTVKARV